MWELLVCLTWLLQGEEVLHLPVIVESAECSPQAAAIAAQQIRKFLAKDNYSRPHVQYNAIMLIRILSDNPGATFTRNIDSKFVSTTKDLLRNCKDPSVQQILRETLSALYVEKAYDTNFTALFQMWNKEQHVPTGRLPAGTWQQPPSQSQDRRQSRPQPPQRPSQQSTHTLPPPVELAARIEEARTSAKLLQQLVQSTPPMELQWNDLVKEFSERCQSAQRSMQIYINCDRPAPDDDTMQTLIETSEQLSLAMSKHSRAVLQARRANAQQTQSPSPPPEPPAGPPPGQRPMNPSQSTGYGIGYTSPVQSSGFNAPPPSVPSSAWGSGSEPTTSISPVSPQFSTIPPIPNNVHNNVERRLSADKVSPQSPPRNSTYTLPARPAVPPVETTSAYGHGAPRQVPQQTPYDDPFSDPHDQDDHDDLYNESPVSTRVNRHVGDAPVYAPQGHPASPTRPPPVPTSVGKVESWRADQATSPDHPYAPAYHTTPSYLHRQESSGDHLTMHGAAQSPPNSSGREGHHISPTYTEEDEEDDPRTPRSPPRGFGTHGQQSVRRSIMDAPSPTTPTRPSPPGSAAAVSPATGAAAPSSSRLSQHGPGGYADYAMFAPASSAADNAAAAAPSHHQEQGFTSGPDGSVHRSNTLSTIVSESEYAASRGSGDGYVYGRGPSMAQPGPQMGQGGQIGQPGAEMGGVNRYGTKY